MGRIYLATSKAIPRAAIKLFSANSGLANALERFKAESEVLMALDHPHIVAAYDAGVAEGGTPYLVMELIEGVSAQKLIETHGPLPEDGGAALLADIAKALYYAHSRGYLHRDIKPENLLITQEGVAKLCDFGVAKDENASRNLTEPGVAVGTADYMSPEQAWGEMKLDARSDLFSLGSTFFHLLTGQMAFWDEDPGKVIDMIRSRRIPPVRDLRPDISSSLSAVVWKLTEPDPGRRFQSAREVVEALRSQVSVSAIPRDSTRRGRRQ
jgi:serine/threonine-protein kinase